MTENTWESRQRLRGYLSRKRTKGPLNEAQEAAWWALNEIDDLVDLLKSVQRVGLTPEVRAGVDAMVKRNTRPE